MAREDGGFAARAGASQAAPTGLQQQRPGGGGPTRDDGGFSAKAGATVNEPNAPRWETGGQSGDTANGYDTPFYATMFRQQQEAADEGSLGDLYKRRDFTGIVTYDGQTDALNQQAKFGDVYESGRKVGNLYDQYDKPTADNIMADLTLDPKTRAEAYKRLQGGDAEAVAGEVDRMREETTSNNAKWLTQQEYNERVEGQKAEFEDGIVDEILTGVSGFAGGVIATWWAGPWALAGGVVGATAAVLNQDEILDQAARAKVQQDMATEQFGAGAGFSTGLYGWSGVAGKFLSPLTNTVHGLTDATSIGDGQSSYYAVDEEGNSTRPAWLTGLGLAAGLGDAVLQFSSGVGQTAYMTQMGGTIAGEVSQIVATGGETFSDQRGDFDSIFTDDKGNFDLGSSAAGIGKIAIDAVQMGGARGLTNMFGRNAFATRNGLTGETVEAGGRLFKLGDDGVAQWARGGKNTSVSMSMLAPSETLTAISTRVQANRLAALREGQRGAVATADDYYRAATQLSQGTGRWTNALVQGVGEGYEEGLQAILEPLSHDDRVDWRDVGEQAMAGFAMGTGMRIGADLAAQADGDRRSRITGGASLRPGRGLNRSTADQRDYARAVLARRSLATDPDATPEQLLPRSQWDKMSASQKKAAAALTPAEAALHRAAFDRLQDSQRADQAAGVWGVEKVRDAALAQTKSEAARAGKRTDGSFVITQHGFEDADRRNDAVVTSLDQVVDLYVGQLAGLDEQIGYLKREGSPEQTAQVQAQRDQLDALLTVLRQRQEQATAAREAGDTAALRAVVDDVNQMLEQSYDGTGTYTDPAARMARQRAATLMFVRNPTDQAGSFQALLPQVSLEQTRTGSDNGLQVSHAILQALGGDFDGDKIVHQAKLVLDDAAFYNVRTGRNLIGAMGAGGTGVNIATRWYQEREAEILGAAAHSSNTAVSVQAATVIDQLSTQITQRYSGAIPAEILANITGQLVRAMEAGNPKAHAQLLTALPDQAGDAFWDFSRASVSNELLWLDQAYQRALQSFQRWNAVHTATKNPEINTDVVAPVKRNTRAWEILQAQAATEGQTLGLRAAGHSLFRQFQKLHYSAFNAQIVDGGVDAIASGLRDLTTLYENLSQGMTTDAATQGAERDQVARTVVHQLRRLVQQTDAPTRSIALYAQTAVGDATVRDGQLTVGPEPITFLQLLLRGAVARDRSENAANVTPELEAKWARLDQLTRPGNGGEAFVEIMGGETLWSLLGDAAGSMGTQLTVEQFTRLYVSQGRQARKVTSQQLRKDPSYGSREGKTDPPYDFTEVEASEVTSFRAVVEAILETGNERVYQRDTDSKTDPLARAGTAGGRYGDRSNMYHRSLTEAFGLIDQAFTSLGSNRTSPEQVRAVFDRYPDFARSVLNLIPDADVNAVFEIDGNQLRYSNWVVEMLTMDPEAAAMHYWRNIKLAQWTAKGIAKGDEDGAKVRTYRDLDDRVHQLMFRLANAGDGGVAYATFLRRLNEARDLQAFLAYVNTELRLRSEPPYVAWVSDVADFDVDKANGGWSSGGGSSTQREAILNLRQRADSLVKEIAAEQASERAENTLMAALLVADQTPADATAGDMVKLASLDKALRYSQRRLTAEGPAAMRLQIVGSQRSFYPQAHTKGIAPDVYVAGGSFQALSDSAGYATQYERILDTLISVDAEDFGTNPQVLAHDAQDSMSGDGATVTWAGMDRSELLRLWSTTPAARPLIRAMLLPSVYELNTAGRLSQQFLTGRSLVDLIEDGPTGAAFKDNPASRFTYLSLVEAEGKREGKTFAAQRFINDVLFAHTTSADRTLTTAKHEERADEAMLRTADILRMVGDVYANVGAEALTELKAELTDVLQSRPGGSALALQREDREYVAMYFEGIAADRENELRAEQAEALRTGNIARATAIDKYLERFKQQLDAALKSDGLARFRASVVVDYSAPAAEIAQKKAELREHVVSQGTTMKTKAPWARDAIDAVLRDGAPLDGDGNPILSTDPNTERDLWAKLADAATAAWLEDTTSVQAAGIAVPELKWGKDFVRRYWDPSYSYLLDDLLDPKSALAKGARNLHLQQHGGGHTDYTPRRLRQAIESWVLSEDRLAGWTVDVARASLEAAQRMDASSAGDAVAMGGISPRRQHTVSTATARTFLVDRLAKTTSTGVIELGDLLSGEGTFVTTLRTESGEVPNVNTPMAMLNGRFARGARIIVPGRPDPIDIWSGARPLGKTYYENAEVAASGYRSLTVRQLRRAVEDALPSGVDPNTVRIEVDYVHPDSQPARGEYYNSVLYEGVSYEMNADIEPSLIATLYFGPGGISPNVQAEALGANKKGKLAYRLGRLFTSSSRKAMESSFATDFSGMLQKKALAIMDRDLGTGKLDPTFFNAVLKNVKLRHFVRGRNADGTMELWEAERVIAWQRANPGVSIDTVLTGATLWKPGPRVLRTMLGETGDQGVLGGIQTAYDQDPSAIPAWSGLTPQHLSRVPGWAGDTSIFQTVAASRSFMTQLSIRPPLTDTQRSAFERGVEYRDALRSTIHTARAANWNEGHAATTAQRAGDAAQAALQSETPGLDLRAVGFPFIGAISPTDRSISERVLQDYTDATNLNGYEAGWIYREHVSGKEQTLASGVITQASVDPQSGGYPKRAEYQVAPGDLVVVELDSFLAVSDDHGKRYDKARQRVTSLAGQWPNIALVEGDGARDLRAEIGAYMETIGYEKVAGSKHLYQPVSRTRRFQTQNARATTLTETHTDTADNVIATFLVGRDTPLEITENAALLVSRNRQRTVAVQTNLVPVNAYGSFGLPQGADAVAKMRATMSGLLSADRLAHLYALSGVKAGTPEAAGIRAAIERWLEVADEQGLPATGKAFGVGDILPLVDRRGRVLLYRHGMKPPKQVDDQLAKPVLAGDAAANVAIYSTEPEPQATTHVGTVVRFETNTQYGLSVQLRVPLQDLMNKMQLEGQGMKYVTTTATSTLLPDHELFANGVGVDLISDLDAHLAKEALGGSVTNFRNAFAYFGMDFTPELTKFFFGQDWAALTDGQRTQARGLVSAALTEIHRDAERQSPAVIEELMRTQYLDTQVEAALREVGLDGARSGWRKDLFDPAAGTNEARIARAAVLYMMLPQAQPHHILSAGGLNNPGARTDQTQTVFMPEIFTNVFDRTRLDDPLREMLMTRLNQQINNPADGSQWYWLQKDFTFSMKNADGAQYDGTLQFSKAYSSGDNPELNGQAFARADRQNWSRHALDVAYHTIGARTAAEKELDRSTQFTQLRSGVAKGSLWEILNATTVDNSTPKWLVERPGETARRQLAYEAVGAFRQPVDREGWTEEQIAQADSRRNAVAGAYGLRASQAEVLDFWVRQMLGMPLGEGDRGRIGFEWYMETLDELQWNADRGLLPTAGAEVPQLHVFDLALLFEENAGTGTTDSPWTLVDGPGSAVEVNSWDGFVQVALGTAMTEHQVFDPMYLLATDGFMHTYQDALDGIVGLPISRDVLVSTAMLDESTDRLLASMDPNTDLVLKEPSVINAERSTFATLMGVERIGSSYRGKSAPESIIAQRRAQRLRWRKENGVPIPLDVTNKNFRRQGVHFIEESTTTHSVMRIMTNLRAGNALLNPLLWVSAGPEMFYRSLLDDATGILTGQGTGAANRAVAAVAGKAGLAPRYTPEEITQLQGLYSSLGRRADFKGLLYEELVFKQPRLANAGAIERFTHRYAQFASGLQDPTYGMPGQQLARRYVEKALEELQYVDTTITPQLLMAHLNRNPRWLKDNLPDVHQAAANNVANIRSLRPTPISLALRGIYEPMSESPSMAVNFAGHLIKIPLLFSGYLTNVLTTITGMQGFTNMAGMFVEGRNKGLIGRIQASMKGQPPSPETQYVDLSTALDGISLAKSFVQGGITHTGLFAMGLAAQGLGLTGEDEEERRLRRAAQVQGGQFLYDPRKIENDFRNADAIFLDWLPPAFSSWFKVEGERGTAMAELPWILKQFVSPMIGMERFFDTGDPRQILWGFQDAVGQMPLFNATSFDNAARMYAELMSNADESAKLGTPKDMAASYGFMVSAVGTLERMLFENSFVNMLYVGFDKYDRDNWKMPLTDSDGDLQRDIMGSPRQTDALSNYVDPETGEVRAGYVNRDWQQATLRQLTENRLGLASLLSLTTGRGLGSDYFRQNMVVKQREFAKPELSQQEAEGLLLSVMDEATYGKSTELLTDEGARAVFQGIYAGTVAPGSPALEGVYITLPMRQAISAKWLDDLKQDFLDAGMGDQAAESMKWDVWLGSGDSPYDIALNDIIWGDYVPYTETVKYNQLNTTYVPGPDGMPWATGVTRDGISNLFGVLPKRYLVTGDANVGTDGRLNTIDEAVQLNTGMRALERTDDTWLTPTDEEIGRAIEEAIGELGDQIAESAERQNGRGWVNYPRRAGWASRGRGGYGGGGSYSPSWGGSWQRMNTPRGIDVPYADDLYSINTANPIIRRATIRRERFSSERGRLNQWQ